jgi:CRP-like cAMP-binding protein
MNGLQTIDDVLAASPFFAGLDEPALRLIAGCTRLVRMTEGEFLLREGAAAESFYVVRHGRVAIETHEPGNGVRTIDTVDDGGVVGWSWLVPPYRWLFDARAVDPTVALHVNAACLRDKCEADPRLGYVLLQRVASGLHERLHAARVRMLDLYGSRS